jgi:hypothetical protein
MAGGVNHAKQIVLDEAADLVSQLQNGCAEDQHTQGRATALLLKMMSPLYAAEFVTIEDCQKQHKEIEQGKKVNIKLGPIAFEGNFNPTVFLSLAFLGVFGAFFFAIGKMERWW